MEWGLNDPDAEGGAEWGMSDEDYKAPPVKKVGVSDETAKAQRGLLTTGAQVHDDTRRGVQSWPARVMTGIAGAPGFFDQLGRDLDTRVFGTPHSETPLPTPDSLMERARGVVGPAASAEFLHDPRTTVGKITSGVLDLAAPSVSKFSGKGRRALEGGLERLDPGAPRLRQSVDAGYGTIAQADVGYDPANWNALSARLNTMLGNSDVSPAVRSIISNMNSQRMAQRLGGNPIRFEEIEETYKAAGRLAARRGASPNDVRVLTDLRNQLDEFRVNSPTVSGNMSGAEAMDIQRRAREQAQRQIRDRRLGRIEQAANRMPSGTTANREVDNQINRLLRSNAPLADEELAQLQRISGPSFTEELLTGAGTPGMLGRAAGGALLGGATGYSHGGDLTSTIIGGALGAAGSTGSNRVGQRMGRNRRARELETARRMARVGPRRVNALVANQRQPTDTDNALIQALLLSGVAGSNVPLEGGGDPVSLGSYLPQDEYETYYGPAGVRG